MDGHTDGCDTYYVTGPEKRRRNGWGEICDPFQKEHGPLFCTPYGPTVRYDTGTDENRNAVLRTVTSALLPLQSFGAPRIAQRRNASYDHDILVQ